MTVESVTEEFESTTAEFVTEESEMSSDDVSSFEDMATGTSLVNEDGIEVSDLSQMDVLSDSMQINEEF